MRIRDFAKHIFFALMVIIALVLVNVFYQYTYNNQLEDYALAQAETQSNSDFTLLESRILSVRNDYINDTYQSKYVIETVDFIYERTFDTYMLAQGAKYEGTDASSWSNLCYVYIYDNVHDRIGRIEFNNLIRILRNLGELDMSMNFFIVNEFNSSGMILSSTFNALRPTSNQVSFSFYSILRSYNDAEVVQTFRDNLNADSVETEALYYAGYEYFMSGRLVDEDERIFFVEALASTQFESAMAQLNTFNVLYFIVNIACIFMLIVTAIVVIRKAMKLIDLNRRHGSRFGTFIIRVRARDGKVISYNRGFKTVFADYRAIKNIDMFTTPTGVPILQDIKSEDKKIGCFFDENTKLGYIEYYSFRERGAYYLIGTNITAEYKQRIALQELTEKNEITGQGNFNRFFRDYDEIKSETYSKNATFALMELTDFQSISTMLGPENSKAILNSMVQIIGSLFPDTRYYHVSEATFLIAFICDTEEELNQKQNKLVDRMKHAVVIGNNNLILQYKIATYTYIPERDQLYTCEQLFNKLEITMEVARTMINRNIVKYDSNVESVVRRRQQMETDMKFAVEHDEFMMYYQPQYDVLEKRIAGFESLIRWNNPKYLHTSPQEYIELAEKNGYIVPIGRFIYKEVFKQAKIFWEYGIHVSINVSPAQLVQTGFVSDLLEEFDANNLQPGSVCIEITETFLMSNFNVLVEKLSILKNKGFSIHLDDFGTGYSSLLYLKELPVDTIKTDKEFLKSIHSDESAAAILKQIINLGKSINLKIISEGVETMDDYNFLRKAGADYIQGYLISRPVPLDDAMKLIREGVNLNEVKRKGE